VVATALEIIARCVPVEQAQEFSTRQHFVLKPVGIKNVVSA
jgi:hypothetical protein